MTLRSGKTDQKGHVCHALTRRLLVRRIQNPISQDDRKGSREGLTLCLTGHGRESSTGQDNKMPLDDLAERTEKQAISYSLQFIKLYVVSLTAQFVPI
jgi:hypothetical protein